MKHSWHSLKLETYPQQKATNTVIKALQSGKIPFRIITTHGTFYVDPNGTYNAEWNIHTAVRIENRMIISEDSGLIIATRTSRVRILAYVNSPTLVPTWRSLL